jgi:hypothetical protein
VAKLSHGRSKAAKKREGEALPGFHREGSVTTMVSGDPIRIEAWAKIHCRNSKSERAGLAVAKLIV